MSIIAYKNREGKRRRKVFTVCSVKFIYSEKATKFCEIFTLLLSYVVPVKIKVKISQSFEAMRRCSIFVVIAIIQFAASVPIDSDDSQVIF